MDFEVVELVAIIFLIVFAVFGLVLLYSADSVNTNDAVLLCESHGLALDSFETRGIHYLVKVVCIPGADIDPRVKVFEVSS